MSYIVVDNFCNHLDKVKKSVFDAGFDTWNPNKGEVGSSIYEGMGFWGEHAVMVASIMRAVNGVVVPNTMYFRVTNVGMEKAYIHSDRESGNHTCICYLTDHDEESGTAFFRHKRTGLISMPSFAEMKESGIMDELKSDMVSRDPDKWEQMDYVKGRLNRALIFRAPLFHSRFPLEGIGTDNESGRLVWVSHFNKLNAVGEFS
jgi:Family of unknown function (DUF6445)